jgi:hypothetical protein
MYLVGEASGPEPDTHGTMMDPKAILGFQKQILERVEAGNPLPYKDSHGKGIGVLEDLGWVMDAAVDDKFHLKVAVKLDDANPASAFLHNSIQRGRQYGMSVKGHVEDFAYAKTDDGKRVMKLFNVVLTEISNTTRPSWVPSFGTILARSVDGESGENEMSEETPTAPAAVEQTTETPVEASAVELSADTQETPAAETQETEIERSLSKSDKEGLRADFLVLKNRMKTLGIDTEDAPETTSETPAVAADPAPATEVSRETETSETGDVEPASTVAGFEISREMAEAIQNYVAVQVAKAVEPLNQSIIERDALIKELEETPAGVIPKVARDKFSGEVDEFASQIARMESPEERLHFALSKLYNG